MEMPGERVKVWMIFNSKLRLYYINDARILEGVKVRYCLFEIKQIIVERFAQFFLINNNA